MSRSRRNSPNCGVTTSKSEKAYKRQRAHERRTREREAFARLLEGRVDPEGFLDPRPPYDPWNGPKDGKLYFGDWLRAEELEEKRRPWRRSLRRLMRK